MELGLTEIPGMETIKVDNEFVCLLFDWSALWYRLGSTRSDRKNYFYNSAPLLHVCLEFFFASKSMYLMLYVFVYLAFWDIVAYIIYPGHSLNYLYVTISVLFCLAICHLRRILIIVTIGTPRYFI
jgi:hypothetical protein